MMKKQIYLILLLSCGNAIAASTDECSIWLCLPGGFPTGCSAAHSAMLKRIEHGKSPLPSLSSCGGDDTEETTTTGVAAYIPEHQICSKYKYSYSHSEETTIAVCGEYTLIPEQYIKNTTCVISQNHNTETVTRTPEYCTHTYRYIDTFDSSGNKIGDTYFY